MFDITSILKDSAKRKNEGLPLGKYDCRVDKVVWAPGFKPGSAFKISYTLYNAAGDRFDHNELFYNSETDRTLEFFEYLYNNGIRDVFDFEGCRETVEIGYTVSGRKRFTGIISRHFVSKESETA